MVSERVRNLIYTIGFGLTLLGLFIMFLMLIGVIRSPEVSLLEMIVGFGLTTVVWGLKDDVGVLKGKMDTLDGIIEAKFSKFERRFFSRMGKFERELGRIEGRLDELSKRSK